MSEVPQHAILSASGAPGWMRCYGKLALEKPFPESSSVYADEGTAAHEVAAMCLEQDQDAAAFVGRIIEVPKTGRKFEVDEEMAEAVQVYLDLCRSFGGDRVIEQKCDYSTWILGQEQIDAGITAYGTTDFGTILAELREIVGIDYKHGQGVRVSAEDNEQQQLYACGLVDMFSLVYDIDDDWTVRLIIAQPRANNISEWVTTVGELKQFALRAKIAARHAMHQYDGNAEPKLVPGEKQCRFCKAKSVCPALAQEVRSTAGGELATAEDFSDLTVESVMVDETASEDYLAFAMDKADLIEGWIKSVRAEVERRLLAGHEVPGYKLVEGKRGHRKWVNPDEAELQLRSMRLKTEQMFDLKLISPTTAEKLAKAGDIGPRQWKKLQGQYAQSAGKPSVERASDARPAITVAATADDFAVIDDGSDLV